MIKIEHVTRGDAARGLGSTGIAGFSGKVAVLMEHANRGKKSLGLDLTERRRAATSSTSSPRVSDVFLTNKMAGVRERLQIEVDDIRAHNPNIVYVRGTGLRQPRSRRRRRRLRLARLLGPLGRRPLGHARPTCPSRSTSPGLRSATRSVP